MLAPQINEATIRLLTRHGVEVVIAQGAGCCGALVHHMGHEAQALAAAKANIDAWERSARGRPRCRGHQRVRLRHHGQGLRLHAARGSAYAETAARVAELATDVTELLAELGLKPPVRASDLVVAYHTACSMQHGQRITAPPKDLLRAAGFTVKDIPEGHICCGSAGTYNLLQPALATRLRARKLANIARVGADVVATGNIGCMVQLTGGTRPSCTPSSCSIGRPADPLRAQLRACSEPALKRLPATSGLC